jgi:hypothetical protein
MNERLQRVDIRYAYPAFVLVLLLTACAATTEESADESSGLLATVISCSRDPSGESARIRVQFGRNGGTPPGIVELLPELRLWGYEYRPLSAGPNGKTIDVGGLPPVPGFTDLLPPEVPGAVVSDRPPTAEIPIEGDPYQDFVFRNILVADKDEVVINANDIVSLVGKTAQTPLGQVTVTDARTEADAVALSIDFDWNASLGDGSLFQLKGSLASSLTVGERDALPVGTSYVISGTSQALSFDPDAHDWMGSVSLRLDQFGVLYPGSVHLQGVEAACS